MFELRQITLRQGPGLRVLQGGGGPPLVWLHGPKRPEADDAVLAALANAFSVTALLLPGQESLDDLDPFPGLHDLMLFYDGALDALGLDNLVLAGHSFGGMLAAELAALNPRRVRALALVSPLGLWNDAHPVEDLFARPYPAVDELLWSGAAQRPQGPVAAEGDVEGYIALANGLGSMAKYI